MASNTARAARLAFAIALVLGVVAAVQSQISGQEWTPSSGIAQEVDFTLTLDNNPPAVTAEEYTVSSVSSGDVYIGPGGFSNPTIKLIVGRRYRVHVLEFERHPLEIVSFDDNHLTTDSIMLAQGPVVGGFESDPAVGWRDDRVGTIEFTLTPNLTAALTAMGNLPRYRGGPPRYPSGFFFISDHASDSQMFLSHFGDNSYALAEVSSPELFDGSLPADDPIITLLIGKRYQVRIHLPARHPFQVLAKGTSASADRILVSQSGLLGSFDSHPAVGREGFRSILEFTMSTELVEAMRSSDQRPGYRCGAHSTSMRGDFNIVDPHTPETKASTDWREYE